MPLTVLTQKSLSLFTAVGGWRTVAEAVVSKTVFLIAHLLTGQVPLSATVAVGAVVVFAIVRTCTDRKYWQAAGGLVIVAVAASLASSSGEAVDFYLVSVLVSVGAGAVFLVSLLVRWPIIGVVVGGMRGERSGWRRDRARLRRYQACTAVFLVKFSLSTMVMVPLYLAGQVTALGIASTLLGTPATGLCAYVCWRILRTEADSTGSDPAITAPSHG
ncbi:DUF3159 domain-containing protein [Nonomuraea turkmeniaca]|uniref:DUF3159 domain-containing protein n=1 Tax=Nonomuraea turkmeniaca TaxID=103838 RepID=A0A5S4FSM3_9ACTN|nr:DUF3159 domain-containing protein [Nonomuraea turkmeniaca]TMR23756.1 DUF3159 domain-containing protein [Nonomuraea turkmeniaca]